MDERLFHKDFQVFLVKIWNISLYIILKWNHSIYIILKDILFIDFMWMVIVWCCAHVVYISSQNKSGHNKVPQINQIRLFHTTHNICKNCTFKCVNGLKYVDSESTAAHVTD